MVNRRDSDAPRAPALLPCGLHGRTMTALSRNGRAAGINPPNRYETVSLTVDGDYLDDVHHEVPLTAVQVRTAARPEHDRSIINPVNSPDLNFNWTINPYRGCEHGCIYCYARPTHELLGYSCGMDFETTIIPKIDAPRLLRAELPRWYRRNGWSEHIRSQHEPMLFGACAATAALPPKPDAIVMSGITDPYQPLESRLRITRQILEVFVEFRQPVSLITKNRLITRDIDLLCALRDGGAMPGIAISITTLDRTLSAKMEPRASAPVDRLRAARELTDAGIPVQVMVAPVIPGLTDHEIPAILEAVAEHGAAKAGWIMLRLPHQVKDLFLEWLDREFPHRAAKVIAAIRDCRDGSLTDPRFRARMRGSGERAAQIQRTFEVFASRYGLRSARHDSSKRSS